MKDTNYKKLVGLTVVMIVLFILVFAMFSVSRIVNNLDYMVQVQSGRLDTLNKLAASSMDDYFGKIDLSLKTADFFLDKNKNVDPRFDSRFIELIHLIETDMAGNVDIRLVSKTGGLFYIPSESEKPLADVSDRKYYSVQMDSKTKGFYIADPVLSRVTKRWGIPISYPLTRKNHGISIIFAAIEIPTLERIFESYQMKQDGLMILTRGDGTVLASMPFDEKLVGKSLAGKSFWSQYVLKQNNKDEVIESDEIDGKVRYISSQKVSKYPLYVISSCSKDEVVKPWKETLNINVYIILFFIVVLGTLGWIMIKILARLDAAMANITYLSMTDPLTGLHNRRMFNERLAQEISKIERYGGGFCVIEMDIDFFKAANDTYGHDAGDDLLIKMSQILKANIRSSDTLARWGGEEFIILLSNTSLEHAEACVEKIRSIINDTDFGVVGHMTASFGVGEYHEGDTLESLFSRVDKLLYCSKRSGRNRLTSERQLAHEQDDNDSSFLTKNK